MADEPVTLEQVKDHLRLGQSQTAQDNYLELLIKAARRSVERDIEMTIVAEEPSLPVDDLPVVREAILLLVSQWFWNREAVSEKALKEVPNAVGWLLWPLKKLSV